MNTQSDTFHRIIPPPRRAGAIILFVGIGVGLLAGWYFALGKIDAGISLVFACILPIMALLCLAGAAIECFAPEDMQIASGQLKITRSLLGFTWSNIFDITLMNNLRVGAANYWNNGTYVFSNGRIEFEYRSKPQAFGVRLSDEETFEILDRIRAQTSLDKIAHSESSLS